LEELHAAYRLVVGKLEGDRMLQPDMEATVDFLRTV